MNSRAKLANACHKWNTKLTTKQRKALLKKHGTFEKALKATFY